jgi:hypothetical protein
MANPPQPVLQYGSAVLDRCHHISYLPLEVGYRIPERQLRDAFALVRSNSQVGEYRTAATIRGLRQNNAPADTIAYHESSFNSQRQVSVFEGDPLTQVLDLTLLPDGVFVYSAAGGDELVQRVAKAVVGEIDRADCDDGARDSPEEQQHWELLRKCRDVMTRLQGAYDETNALWAVRTPHLVRVHDLKITEPRLAFKLEPIPMRGLSDCEPMAINWFWDDFVYDCKMGFWRHGPRHMKPFWFGEMAEFAMQFCESAPLGPTGLLSVKDIERGMQELDAAALAPYCQGVMELLWETTLVGWVRDQCVDQFPCISGSVRLAELGPRMRQALARRAKEEYDDDDGNEEDVVRSPDAEQFMRGWWLRAPDGAVVDVFGDPKVDFHERTIEWWYSRRIAPGQTPS